jgi:hypothetical protein
MRDGAPVMTIDWKPLEQRTEAYTTLTSSTDPVSKLVSIVYCGLHATLSQVLAAAPSGAYSVAIFADTLDLDVASAKTAGLIVMARDVNCAGLGGQPLILDTSGRDGIAQFLIGGVSGGTFALATPGTTPVYPPASPTARASSLYMTAAGAALEATESGGLASVQDLVSRSWALNTLAASYAAAAWLMDVGTKDARAAALAIFGWVTAATSSLAGAGQQLPSDYGELYNQAAALLITLDVASGTVFVPVLSGDVYGTQMDKLITVLRDYEAKATALDTATDIAGAISTVSAALAAVAEDETAPLQLQLDNASQRINALYTDINDLRGDFMLQSGHAHTAFEVMGDAIQLDDIKAKLQAELDTAMSVINLGFDCAKIAANDTDGLRGAINDSVAGIQNLAKLIEAAQGGSGGDDLSRAANALMATQQTMMSTLLNGRLLWQQAIKDRAGGVLPADLAAVTFDPSTSWDNYLAAAEGAITTLQRSLGSGGLAASDTYLASLKILVGYGKAIGAKFAAYVGQLLQATVLIAQIKAAKDVEARWQAVKAKATTDAEKLAALKAVVASRSNAIKRSIYVAWTYYAASYFYLNFAEPPHAVHLDMDAAAIEDALAGVAAWVAAATGTATDGEHVRLPNSNANITLDFAVLAPGAQAANSGPAALAQQTTDGGWRLTWALPLGTEQLDGVLPNSGNCAIWISQGSFFLDGATPNNKGNIIASVATSGSYQNGFGAAAGHAFATKGLTGDYAYDSTGKVYSPWKIDSAVYMTPTPYTQWTMTFPANGGNPSTAARLRMQLTVAYSTP